MIALLRARIALLSRSDAPDEAGGAAVSFAPGAEIWAGVERLAAALAPADPRVRRLRRIRALIRSRSDVAIGGRVRFEDADYAILSIEKDGEKGRRLFLTCEETVK